MSSDDPVLLRDRWARLRFAVVGTLLMAPPKCGELKAALKELSMRSWEHPRTKELVRFGYSTIEKWLHKARRTDDPVRALRERPRGTAGRTKRLTPEAIEALRTLYYANTNWSAKLLADNLRTVMAEQEPDGPAPSYHTVRRYLRAHGLRQRPLPTRDTQGTRDARERLDTREIRSYEVDAFGVLWHADFHDGSRKVLTKSGELITPQLFGCIDDHSRLITHLQWYTNERIQDFVHGLSQAFQKRHIPRTWQACHVRGNGKGAVLRSPEMTGLDLPQNGTEGSSHYEERYVRASRASSSVGSLLSNEVVSPVLRTLRSVRGLYVWFRDWPERNGWWCPAAHALTSCG